ncbi:entericidin A/B family lipoprotein [Nitrosomonas communis]|nr:entericidin A/B family lipoprotein [Nitrosomonas communis]MCO6426555.1 entericidin A/B family lipoprotein [Nitrosomonas communis]
MKMLSVLIGSLMIALQLSGCHTLQGVGKDIQRGGEAIEKSAQ